MKSLVPILFLFCSINVNAQKWCAPGATWLYRVDGFFSDGTSKITYVKDSLILNHNCQILKAKTIVKGYPIKYQEIWTYSTKDTVFIYQKYQNDFKPLFMFNVKVGDTIEFGTSMVYTCKYKKLVYAKGTMVINNDSLRYYDVIVADCDDIYVNPAVLRIVERFGALWAFMNPFYNDYTDPVMYEMTCYHDDDFGDHVFYNNAVCEEATSTTEIKTFNFEVYPNPATQEISLINTGNEKISLIEVFDTKGSKQVIEKNFENSKSINVANLNPGIYYLKIETIDGIVGYKKFLKQ